MSRYIQPSRSGIAAVACCGRCGFKVRYTELVQDPNNQLWVCRECKDQLDPWRLPAHRTEDVSLQHPRPDEELV